VGGATTCPPPPHPLFASPMPTTLTSCPSAPHFMPPVPLQNFCTHLPCPTRLPAFAAASACALHHCSAHSQPVCLLQPFQPPASASFLLPRSPSTACHYHYLWLAKHACACCGSSSHILVAAPHRRHGRWDGVTGMPDHGWQAAPWRQRQACLPLPAPTATAAARCHYRLLS